MPDSGFHRNHCAKEKNIGGMGLGKVELILLMEEAGYALFPGPFNVTDGGTVIDACGFVQAKERVPSETALTKQRG